MLNTTREKLLEAAVDTIGRQGFNGCGVQDIVGAAGVPKGSFYNHFDSKEALGAAAIGRYWQRASSFLGVLSDPALAPRDRLHHYLQALHGRLQARSYAGGCLVGNLAAELAEQSPLIAGQLAAALDGWTGAVEACIRDGQSAGQIKPGLDPAAAARFFVNALQGAILRARVERSGTALADAEAMLLSLLLAP